MIPSALYTIHIKVPPANAIPPTDMINNNATAICPKIMAKNGCLSTVPNKYVSCTAKYFFIILHLPLYKIHFLLSMVTV